MIKIDKFLLKNQSRLLINLDWLTLNISDVWKNLDFSSEGLISIGEFVISLREGRTRNFNKLASVLFRGVPVGTLAFDSNSKLILNDRAHFKLENSLFYTGDCHQLINEFIKAFEVSDVKVSRVDIAVDGVYLHEFLNNYLYEKDEKKRVDVVRLRDVDNIAPVGFTRDNLINQSFDSFRIGNFGSKSSATRKGAKVARYYNKTKEIEEVSKKEYITDYYKENGFEGQVFRYEIELASAYLNKLDQFEWFHLFDTEKLKSLFNTAQKQFLEFIEPVTNNVTNCPRIELFEGLEAPLYIKKKQTNKDNVRTIKTSIKRLIHESYLGELSYSENFKESTKQVVFELLEKYDLYNWFASISYPLYYELLAKSIELGANLEIDNYVQLFDNHVNN